MSGLPVALGLVLEAPAAGHMALELRSAHDPAMNYGFADGGGHGGD